jgi:D-citramalate synthase
LDPDQNAAAIKATIRMLNIFENEFLPGVMEKIQNNIS